MLGKQIYFVTNNGTKTRHDIWRKANHMNYFVDEDHIITPTYSIAEYLKLKLQPEQQVYVIGSAAFSRELNHFNISNFGAGEDLVQDKWDERVQLEKQKVAAVVVGFDEHFSFMKMLKAANFLTGNANCLFLATNTDAVHRYPQYSIPGTGTILESIQTCAGVQAKILGKPNPLICEKLMRSGAIDANRTLMVGDW